LSVAVNATSRRLRLGGGSVIGGRVGLFIAPDLLRTLAVGRRVVLVTGTNGKTTTTRLLAAALGGPSDVATSSAGANLPPGLVAALAASAPAAPAALEVDEGYLGKVADDVDPAVVTLLNLSRDQLDRVSEVRMIAERWRDPLARLAGVVVANVDDPLVVWGAQRAERVRWVAAGQLWHQDSAGCPACDGRIRFEGENGGGDWWCECGFRRPDPDAVLRGDVLVTVDGRKVPVRLSLPGRCNLANAAMAAVAANVLGIDEAESLKAMEAVGEVEGRFATVVHGGVSARLLLAKNPAGWRELLDLLEGGADPMVVGINARVADGHDPSWLWDVPFERLAGRRVVATGERGRDLAVRLRHAGVPHVYVADQLDAITSTGARRVEYVGNYTAFQVLRRQLRRAHRTSWSRSNPQAVVVTPAPPGTPLPLSAVEETGTLDLGADTDGGPDDRGSDGSGSDDRSADSQASPPARRASGAARSMRGATPCALRVVVVHPDLLGTYGDSGNGRIVAGRALWRGTSVELIHADSDETLPAHADVYCLGGGEDGPQVQSAARLRAGNLAGAVERGAVVLAVCAGYQILGQSFPGADGRIHDGVGVLDVVTFKGGGRRAVGELAVMPLDSTWAERAEDTVPEGSQAIGVLTGFENHAGVTHVGVSARPLGQVMSGIGNGSADGTDGARQGNVVGTYLHGPVLARNPRLADAIIAMATGSTPAPLDDEEELALRAERLGALGTSSRVVFARRRYPMGSQRRLATGTRLRRTP
jgi:CobQ-like glutamine amidotransferase family enzyme/UDP-N-acetylmuramyl tripeptide synthase